MAQERDVIYTEGDFRIEIDRSPTILKLEIPDDVDYVNSNGRRRIETPLMPTLPKDTKWDSKWRMVSASMLAQKAKVFDDGLLATVQLAAQEGAGTLMGKRQLLKLLTDVLNDNAEKGSAADIIRAAEILGSAEDQPSSASVQSLLAEFQNDSNRSKPLGFYTWSPELKAVFQQDRVLQTPLRGEKEIQSLTEILKSQVTLQTAYAQHLDLIARLTNPSRKPSLKPTGKGQADALNPRTPSVFFLPPSRSPETDIIMELYGDRPIPEGFTLIDEMISRIRNGKLDLTPTKESGWYDYQLWAAAPLLEPEQTKEAERLRFGARYKKQLEDLFKAIVALSRESHVKDLEVPEAGAMAAIFVYPDLQVEPLATYYLRRAAGYRFVRKALEGTFGAEALGGLFRLRPDGAVKIPLSDELANMEQLFFGAYAVSLTQLGGKAEPNLPQGLGEMDREASARYFTTWKANLPSDPDVSADLRMMVPLYYDLGRKMTKVWVFLGWAERPLEVSWVQKPRAFAVGEPPRDWDEDRRKDPLRNVYFDGSQPALFYPVTAEVYVSELMDREQFRAHCDRYQTRSEILANLPSQGHWLMSAERTIRNVPWMIWVGGGLLLGTVVTFVMRRRKRKAAAPGVPS